MSSERHIQQSGLYSNRLNIDGRIGRKSAMDAVYEIEDVLVLDKINHPLRLRMLYQLGDEARTVKELAERLDVPVTRLYYHLDQLQSVGLIEVVDTRKSGARLQRVYRAVATRFQPGRSLFQASDPPRVAEVVASTVLDGARLDATAGVLSHLGDQQGEPVPGTLGRTMVPISREAALEFTRKLEDLVAELETREDPDGEEYAFSFVFFPMVAPVRGETP